MGSSFLMLIRFHRKCIPAIPNHKTIHLLYICISYIHASGRNVLPDQTNFKIQSQGYNKQKHSSMLGCPQWITRRDMVVGTGLNLQGYEYNKILIKVFTALAALAVLTVMVTVVITKATEYHSLSQSVSQSVSYSHSHYFWFIFVSFWIQTLDWRQSILTTGFCGFTPSLQTNVQVVILQMICSISLLLTDHLKLYICSTCRTL
jgi:hypothetical protein